MLKKYLNRFCILMMCMIGNAYLITAQTVLSADGPGNTYELINSKLSPGYVAVEAPDQCTSHPSFGRHIAEVFDNVLNKHVFEFYIHVPTVSPPYDIYTADNDRCINFDRQRVEIKTYDQSPDSLKGTYGETVTYKWRFKLQAGFKPSTSFTHIHQVKAVGGDDDNPLFTITVRKASTNRIELNYYIDSTSTGTRYATAPLSSFLDVWVEATETISIADNGTYSMVIKRVSDGTTLLTYSNNNIQTIRCSNSFIRPKWGIYRSLNTVADLRDDTIRIADISIAEVPVTLNVTSSASTICSGSAVSFTATPSVSYATQTYQWFVNGVNVNNNATTYSTSSLSANSNIYCVVSTKASCSNTTIDTSNIVPITVLSTGSWSGLAGTTNTATAGNWCGGLPSSTTDVIIPNGLSNYPVLQANLNIKNLNLASAASLSVNGNTLQINGALSGTGTIIGSPTSTIIFAAGASGTLNMNQTTLASTNALYNLTCSTANNTVTLANSVSIYNNLNIQAGTFNANNQLVTLESTSANTAMVDRILGTLQNANNVTIERYKQNRRAWLLVTAPLSANNAVGTTAANTNANLGTIKDNWQQFTHITGNAANGTNGGLDAGSGNNWGIFNWTTNGWAAVTNTTNNYSLMTNTGGSTADNKSFLLFVRGNRTIVPTAALNTSSATILMANGRLQQGNLTASITKSTGGYALVGNPYAAPINLELFRQANSNLTNTFYYWNPNINTTGGYVACTADGNGTFTTVPSGGTSLFNQNVGIQSGQAFFVMPGNATTVSFSEAMKQASLNGNSVFGSNGNSSAIQFGITLQHVDSNQQINLLDGVAEMYKSQYNDSIDMLNEDVAKWYNNGENLSILYKQSKLSINKRHDLPSSNDTIQLWITGLKDSVLYGFKFELQNLTNRSWYLHDTSNNTLTAIDSLPNALYYFQANSAMPSTKQANRFSIVSTPIAPLSQINIQASWLQPSAANQPATLIWYTPSATNMLRYEVMGSDNGINFTTIAVQAVEASQAYYQYIVKQGYCYYTIKAIQPNGQVCYSNILKAKQQPTQVQLLQANTVQAGDKIALSISKQVLTNGKLGALLVSTTGQVYSLNTSMATDRATLTLPQPLAAGYYFISLPSCQTSIPIYIR